MPRAGRSAWENRQVTCRTLARWVSTAFVLGTMLVGCGGPSAVVTTGRGPAKQFACRYDTQTEAYTGAYGTASAIGWLGNNQGVVTCLGGTFFVQDGIDRNFGFGIYDGSPTTWSDLDGYLPAQITTFSSGVARVVITEFADKDVIGGDAFVAVYSQVAVTNPSNRAIYANPEPSGGLTPSTRPPTWCRRTRR